MTHPTSLTKLRIISRDEEFPEKVLDIPLSSSPDVYAIEQTIEVDFPGGHKLLVGVEVSLEGEMPEICLSIEEEEGGRGFHIRCSDGVVISYSTSWNRRMLFQIGTGDWK